METPIIINNLTKKFGDVVAVNDVSVTIEPRTFLTLLGPSGCGKTTLLRCISGLEDPDEGEIYIGDRLIYSHVKGISVPPGQRELGMVFQNYALWPHMTVYKNMTFALEMQKLSKEEMDRRVKQSLEEVKMTGYEGRYPREMSGGQQQRIALARMLAYRPKVFLMDEPLSNLDARLRMDMRTELKRLHHLSDATTIYVTHDQLEAMTMSSNIAVMKEGVIQQMDTPDKVYHYPANLFVADFIGNPKINLLEGWISGQDLVDLGKFNVPAHTYRKTGEVTLAVHPEDICIHPEPVEGGVEFIAYSVLPSGADTTIIAHKGDTELIVKEMGVSKIAMDQKIWLTFNKDAVNLYDKASGKLVTG
ncbi:MAG TPA: ABC transporter ATP-binding protein [Anaerolineaceae bacterium]|nr:ABC transporter ATP-binding protein [Anaerolineaceae bacterium]